MNKSLAERSVQIRKLVLSATAKNSAILFGGNFLNSILALAIVIFVSRALGPTGFGILAVFNAVNTTLIGLTNFGLDTAAIKLISSYLDKDRRHSAIIMKSVFYLEMASGLIIIVAGLFLSDIVARALGGEHLILAVRLAFLASAFGSAAAFIGPFFVAYQRFIANSIVSLAGGVARLIMVAILIATVGLNLSNVLWVYTLVPIVFFFVGLAWAPKDWRIKSNGEENKAARHEIFHFSKWILLSYFATVLTGKIDVFLLSKWQGVAAVGLYAAAIQLCSVMPLLIGAISTVLLPQISRYTERDQYISYLKKVIFGAAVVSIVLLPVVIFGQQLISIIFGAKYSGSYDAFRIMFVAYIVALFANPISLVLYAINKPSILTKLNYVQLAISFSLNVLLIPILGITGAALAFLGINLFGAITGTFLAFKYVREYGR